MAERAGLNALHTEVPTSLPQMHSPIMFQYYNMKKNFFLVTLSHFVEVSIFLCTDKHVYVQNTIP